MIPSLQKPFLATTALVLVAGGLLVGCDKATTTAETPSGTTTTTTIAPSQPASQAMTRVGDAVADAAVTTKVKAALLADSKVKGLQIDVDTQGGAVTLNGTADSAPNAERAVTIAKGISGVKSVDNRLTVKTPG